MRLQTTWMPLLLCGVALISTLDARRIRVRPLPQEEQEEETIQYYAAEPQEGEQGGVVYISSADQYNGLYGQPAASRSSQNDNNYIQQVRASPQPKGTVARQKEASKAPPVQTIRNYNKVNDDGSFTFGYEAADGSFKEETRGTDCVVRGKYGYVDPDGNKREFTYVSGNPCDPNAAKDEELEDRPEEDKPDNEPANYPTRPIRPIRPVTAAPKPVTLFQNTYSQREEEEQPEPEQVLKQQPVQHIRTRPVYLTRQYEDEQEQEPEPEQQYHRARQHIPSTTPSSIIYKHSVAPINITPRPHSVSTARSELATTYRPQLLQVAVTPRPALLYTKQISQHARPSHLSSPTTPTSLRGSGSIDFDAEFQKFQQENNVVGPTPSSIHKQSQQKPGKQPGGQIYSSELVFDPASGQYNTQLYQTLPQTEGDFSLNHRIQPYVHQQQHQQQQQQLVNVQQLQSQSPLYRQVPRPVQHQQQYQQQQSELQFQNSAQLFAQQQKARSQQQQTAPQQFYYIQPNHQQPQSFHHQGQIDSFLRGHNIQF